MGSEAPFYMTANKNIVEMEYAVRGPIPQRAAVLKREGLDIVSCNIGNPQALGQKPITFYRQVLSLIEDPARIERERFLANLVEDDLQALREIEPLSSYVLDLSESILTNIGSGLGAYTESKGPLFIREAIAKYIDSRDDVEYGTGVAADPENIYLTNGASSGAKYVLSMLISDENDGVMIPIPQYPLYSATVKELGGVQVNYYPDEDAGWAFNWGTLEDAYNKAKQDGVKVKCIVVINPGNPTGAVLDEESIRTVIRFAKENEIAIIADEVYQENTYGAEFFSFAKVLEEERVPLFSLHSTSKGYYGECGHRGGYLEVRNPPLVEGSDMTFADVLQKQASVGLCSNTVGQVLTYLMVSPPEEGSEPYEKFVKERESILTELSEKAEMIRSAFEEMDGVECFGRTGAMYLFPRLNKLPVGTTDFDYCMNLLEQTGLVTVNGSGFGQAEGTNHLRIAFLPPKSLLEKVLPQWITFHNEYVNQ